MVGCSAVNNSELGYKIVNILYQSFDLVLGVTSSTSRLYLALPLTPPILINFLVSPTSDCEVPGSRPVPTPHSVHCRYMVLLVMLTDKITGSGAKLLPFKPQPQHSQSVEPWQNYLRLLGLYFLINRMGILFTY